MSAYAALLSLHQTLGLLSRRACLCGLVGDLLRFIDENQIPELERDITEAAYKSIDFIDNHILNSRSIFSIFTFSGLVNVIFCLVGFYIAVYEEYRYLMPFVITVVLITAFKVFTESRHLLFSRMVIHSFDEILIRISGSRQTTEDRCDPASAALNTLRRNASLNNTELQAITDAAYEARYALRHYPSRNLTLKSLISFYYTNCIRAANLLFHALPEMMIGDFNLMFVYFILYVQFVINLCSFGCAALERITYLLDKRYSEKSKHQTELSQIIDDFNMAVRDVTKNKDAFGSQSELPAASSKPHLGGSGRAGVVVGLDNDMTVIKSRMLQNWSKRKIVSIVGMGGIGKTTLATQVYNDPEILRHFDIQAWVKVSQEYSLRCVLLSLLHCLISQLDSDSAMKLKQEMQKHNDQELGVDLHKILMGRRYLIVMDDVWDTQVWDFMSIFYPENNDGSCVLLTSRLSNVASYPDSSIPLHQMQCLNDEDSWYLLHQLVFGAEGYPIELETYGREIARCCRGLPLTISVVGGFIYEDNRIEIWRKVAKELRQSESREIKEQCLEILGLSYKHLPLQLKPCFVYMGVFSGDYEIPISRLINLWVAEGFLGPHPSKNMEELGEQNLKALINRNLILVSKRSCNGKIKTCSIHDLLKDVCVLIAKEDNFFHVVESQGCKTQGRPDETTRKLSIHPDALHIDAKNDLMSSSHSLHSFLCIASKPITDCKPSVYLDFMHLRVLDVLAVHFDEFPHQIIKLWFLRYLAFHYDGPFSASISKLKNLETIVHHHCLFGKNPLYPMVIWRMPKLRHIYVKPGYDFVKTGYDLSQFLWGLKSLVHLQTLVGAKNQIWSQSVVRRIKNLKKLVISYDVSSSMDWSQYQLECLVELHQLESLKITMALPISNVPPMLVFPQKLKKLSLSGCGIPWAEMAGMGALSNLEALKLRREAFCGPLWETVEEQFPQLTFLLLEEMCFSCWETDAAHVPHLQHLVIKSCGALEEFPYCLGDIPTLEMIELINCHTSAVDSAREMQKEQESMGNADLKLHILSWGFSDEQQQEGVDDSAQRKTKT